MSQLKHYCKLLEQSAFSETVSGSVQTLADKWNQLVSDTVDREVPAGLSLSRSVAMLLRTGSCAVTTMPRIRFDTFGGPHDEMKLRVPTPPGKSWKVLDFLLKIPGPGKSWKLMLKIMENCGKISLKVGHHFSSGLNGTQSAVVQSSLC